MEFSFGWALSLKCSFWLWPLRHITSSLSEIRIHPFMNTAKTSAPRTTLKSSQIWTAGETEGKGWIPQLFGKCIISCFHADDLQMYLRTCGLWPVKLPHRQQSLLCCFNYLCQIHFMPQLTQVRLLFIGWVKHWRPWTLEDLILTLFTLSFLSSSSPATDLCGCLTGVCLFVCFWFDWVAAVWRSILAL